MKIVVQESLSARAPNPNKVKIDALKAKLKEVNVKHKEAVKAIDLKLKALGHHGAGPAPARQPRPKPEVKPVSKPVSKPAPKHPASRRVLKDGRIAPK